MLVRLTCQTAARARLHGGSFSGQALERHGTVRLRSVRGDGINCGLRRRACATPRAMSLWKRRRLVGPVQRDPRLLGNIARRRGLVGQMATAVVSECLWRCTCFGAASTRSSLFGVVQPSRRKLVLTSPTIAPEYTWSSDCPCCSRRARLRARVRIFVRQVLRWWFPSGASTAVTLRVAASCRLLAIARAVRRCKRIMGTRCGS